MNITALHTADWHLKNDMISECRKVLEFLVEKAKLAQPDVIEIDGDIFDSGAVKLDSPAAKLAFEIVHDLADIAPVAILIGTPSHDGTAADGSLSLIRAKHNVWVSSRPEQIALVDRNGVTGLVAMDEVLSNMHVRPLALLSRIPQPTKQWFEQNVADIKATDHAIADQMKAIFTNFGAVADDFKRTPHILGGHWNTTGSLISKTQTLTGQDIEIPPDYMYLANADVICLGHIHKRQRIEQNIYYCGSTYRKTWGELDEKGFYFHHIDRHLQVTSEFIETPTRKLTPAGDDFTKKPIEDLETVLFAQDKSEIAGAEVRTEIKVYDDEAGHVDKKKLEAFYLGAGAVSADIRIIRVPRETIRSERILKITTLPKKIKELRDMRGEEITEGELDKARMLESMTPDAIVQQVSAAIPNAQTTETLVRHAA
jgi:DNA repair protein SbcD/Mre11